MGAWGHGPFDNDIAADFAGDLDELTAAERPAVVEQALAAAAGEAGHLDGDLAALAVAAAAVVAAQRHGDESVDSVYGPKEAIPPLSDEVRDLASQALVRVLADDSELSALWADTDDGTSWTEQITRLIKELAG